MFMTLRLLEGGGEAGTYFAEVTLRRLSRLDTSLFFHPLSSQKYRSARMALPEPIPIIDNKAYNKDTSEYVSYASRSDAMLASLQTFHEVPYQILDLVMAMITHQDFDSKQVTLKNSADVIQHIEEARLEERMALVQRRSTVEASGDVIAEQPCFPEFILLEVLDIFHAEREAALQKACALDRMTLVETPQVLDIQAGTVFGSMSLVHRSWTSLAQKQLGRILYINSDAWYDNVLRIPYPALFGPWTNIAFILPPEYDIFDYIDEDGGRYMSKLRRLMVKFTKLRSLYITIGENASTNDIDKLYGEILSQNPELRVLQLYALSDAVMGFRGISLDPLLATARVSKLEVINLRGVHLSGTLNSANQFTAGFTSLRSVNYYCTAQGNIDVLLNLLSFVTSIDSLLIADCLPLFSSREIPVMWSMDQLASMEIWPQLRRLEVTSYDLQTWTWPILSLCNRLHVFILQPLICTSPNGLRQLPKTIRYIKVLPPFFWTIENFPTIKHWLLTFSELLNPSSCPDLAFVVLNIPEVEKKYPDREVVAHDHLEDEGRTIRQHNEDIHIILDEIRSRCNNIGAQCTLIWNPLHFLN